MRGTVKLSQRITLMVTAMVGLILVLVIGLITLRLSSDFTAFASAESIQVTKARGSELGKLLDTHYRELCIIALQAPLVKGTRQEAEAFALGMRKAISEDVSSVLVAWPEGKAITPDGKSYVDVSARPYFKAIMSGQNDYVISDPLISKGSGKPAVILAKAIIGADGKLRGLIAFELQLDSLSQIIKTIELGKTGYGWVVDGKGLFIAHPKPAVLMQMNVTDSDKNGYVGLDVLGKRIVASDSGFGSYTNLDHKNVTSFYSVVPNSPGWRLGLSVETSELLANVRALDLLLLVILVASLAIAVVVSILIARSIVKPVELVMRQMAKLSEGDLVVDKADAEISAKLEARGDELGSLGKAMAAMRSSLTTSARNILEAAGQVASGSIQLSSTAQGLSQGATEQASTIEELSASTEELATMARQTGDNTSKSGNLARQVESSAEATRQAVEKSILSMQSIASKIGIVSEISRQTNMLALNAAIEAARAGEVGKGFAVVASEVRKLAESSHQAAEEIERLTQSSFELTSEAGTQLGSLMPKIRETTDLIQEISASMGEQAGGTEEMAKATNQLEMVVQTNAASAEQLAATSEELSAQAQSLKEIVGFFRLED